MIARGRRRARGDRRRRAARACSCSTRPTRSTPSAARELAFRHPDGVARLAPDRRGPRGAARAGRGGVRAHAARRRAAAALRRGRHAWPSCTTSPATSSATDTAEGVRVARPPAGRLAERFDRVRGRNGDGARVSLPRSSRLGPRRRRLPDRAHEGDAGYDLCALEAGRARARASGRRLPHAASRSSIPPGHGRAGAAALRARRPSHGIALGQRPGPDRRGLPRRAEGAAAQHRPRASRSRSRRGDRIAQLVRRAVSSHAEVVEVDALSDTARGEGGFGSSGR